MLLQVGESFHAPDARAWVGNQGVAPSKRIMQTGNMQFKSKSKGKPSGGAFTKASAASEEEQNESENESSGYLDIPAFLRKK